MALIGELHDLFQQEIRDAPRILIKALLKKKLTEINESVSDDILEQLVEQILGDETDLLEFDDGDTDEIIDISFDDTDLEQLQAAFDYFNETQIHEVIEEFSVSHAKIVTKSLKSRWLEQFAYQKYQTEQFRHNLEDRWGNALHLLRMLLTISYEIGDETYQRWRKSRARRNQFLREAIIKLHGRACQVAGEIIVLMESGFADGAIARWRTLHEIYVVMLLLSDNGDEMAERYLNHENIEAKRALDQYLRYHKDHGYRPPSKRECREVEKRFQEAVRKYGKDFASQYGWACHHLGRKNPNFADLEASAGRAMMRSHYKMASYNVHAGTKGIAFRLGALGDPATIISGASNAGLEEPGENTALTLAHLNLLLLGPKWRFDDIVLMRILDNISKDAVREFARAARRLERDEKRLRAAAKKK